jgi:tetratricopeptide (TPR) repeat protein
MGLFKTDEEKKKEYIETGLKYANENEHEKAIKEFEKALKLFPNDEDSLFNLGFVYADMGDNAKAYESFKALINTNPKHIEAFNNLGLLFAKQGKYSDAVFVYEKGIEHNPEAALLYNNMGNVYYDTGKYEKALQCFKKAGDLDPVYSERLYHLGISSVAKDGKMDDMIKKLEESAKKNINKAKNAHDLGVAYMDRKMHDKAIEAFNNSLSIDPNYLSSYVNLGYCYQHKDKLDMAIKAFEKALILNPKSAKTYNTIGLLYDKLEKPEIAVKAYRKAVSLDPTYANSHYMLGQLYQNRGNMEKAVAEFTKHIRIHEQGGMVEDAMQRIADMKSMTFDQIKELFDQYIEEKPAPKPAAPPPQMEKRDERDYMKNLKDKLVIQRSTPLATPAQPAAPQPSQAPAAQPATVNQAKAIDPQEYMRQLKAKMQQKKTGAVSPAAGIPVQAAPPPVIQPAPTVLQQPPAFKITQTGFSVPKPEAAPQPVQPASEIQAEPVKQEISLPPPPPQQIVNPAHKPPVINQPMAEPTIERIEDDIQVVSFEEHSVIANPQPKLQPNAPVPPRPAPPQAVHSDFGPRVPDSGLQNMPPPQSYMETIIKPVGQNVALPTDSMPEFKKQPPPARGQPLPNQSPGATPQPKPNPQTPLKNDEGKEPPSKIRHNYW